MPILTNEMMRAVIMDHSSNPTNKHTPKGEGYQKVHMHSDNCIDDEAIVFVNTSKQAARIRCATIGWNAANSILKEGK